MVDVDRVGTLSPWVCDACLVGLIVLISRDEDERVIEDVVGPADGADAVIDACG